MPTIASPSLVSNGKTVDTSPECFGFLRDSSAFADDPERLREIMASNGHLYIRGFFDREQVYGVRSAILNQLDEAHHLRPETPMDDGVYNPENVKSVKGGWRSRLDQKNPALLDLLYGPRMMGFFDSFLGGKATHYDYTWFRVVQPGPGTPCHCDIVYMGRGTFNLFTVWTPLGDISLEMGGLMVLENSHRLRDRLQRYLMRDVDVYCSNGPRAEAVASGKWVRGFGSLSKNPPQLRQSLGGRWLTCEYAMGDIVIFSMGTVHCSLDNQTDRYRLSTDTRYQLASEPIDERWIGENPAKHGPRGKRGVIC